MVGDEKKTSNERFVQRYSILLSQMQDVIIAMGLTDSVIINTN